MALTVTLETLALIKDFLDHRRTWDVSPESSALLLACLEAIETRGEPGAAVLLWPGIDPRPSPDQHRILEVMSSLLTAASAQQVISLIHATGRMNQLWSQQGNERWWNLSASAVRSLAEDRPACTGLMVLLSGHRSGYVREAALLGLDGVTAPCVLPALPDRLNDWVEPVRRAAMRAMRGFLSAEQAATLVGSLDLLDGLRRCGRADHHAVLDQIDMVLREPAARPAVQTGLSSPIPAIRRGCYSALLLGTHPDDWLEWGLQADDPWIQRHAAHALRQLPPDRVPAGSLDRMAACILRPVRQIAVEMMGDAGDILRLRGFLLDRSPTVREFARFYLGKALGRFDAPAFYRDGLASVSEALLPRFLAGLGETGGSSDVPAILPHTWHRRSAVRLSALRALARLAPGDVTAPFLNALSDRSGRIRDMATAALAARCSAVPIGRLTAWADTAVPAHRRCAVRLLAHYPTTTHLPVLLPFLSDADEGVRILAETICLRGLAQLLNPFLAPDPWQVWAERHCPTWSSGHRDRVLALIRARARGRS